MSSIYRCQPYCRNAVGDDWTWVVEITFPLDIVRYTALHEHTHDSLKYVFAGGGITESGSQHFSRWVFKNELDAMQFLLEQA